MTAAVSSPRDLRRFGYSAHEAERYQARALPEPTAELPGSPGKVAVLAIRAAANQQLWHPDDAQSPVESISLLCRLGPLLPLKGVSR